MRIHYHVILVTDALIERHLEDILINNRRAVTGVLQTELSNTLKAQDRRKRASNGLETHTHTQLPECKE